MPTSVIIMLSITLAVLVTLIIIIILYCTLCNRQKQQIIEENNKKELYNKIVKNFVNNKSDEIIPSAAISAYNKYLTIHSDDEVCDMKHNLEVSLENKRRCFYFNNAILMQDMLNSERDLNIKIKDLTELRDIILECHICYEDIAYDKNNNEENKK